MDLSLAGQQPMLSAIQVLMILVEKFRDAECEKKLAAASNLFKMLAATDNVIRKLAAAGNPLKITFDWQCS